MFKVLKDCMGLFLRFLEGSFAGFLLVLGDGIWALVFLKGSFQVPRKASYKGRTGS